MIMDTSEKLRKLKLYLTERGITQEELAIRFNVTPSHISGLMNGRTKFGKRTAKIWSDELGLSYSWLLTGEGEMLAVDVGNVNRVVGIPFVEGENVNAGALAGYGEGLNSNDITDHISLPALAWRDGDFAVRTRGRSMIDKQHPEQNINDGAIVVLRPWREHHIQWGEIYCIATNDGYAVKRLMPGNDERHVTCVSSNENEGYMPYQVEYQDIQGIAKVTAIINMQLL